MFSKLFSKKKPETFRELNHPNQLEKGDMVILDDGFVLPQDIRNQSFIVENISGYQYQYGVEASFRLRGDGRQPVFLSIDEEDGEAMLCISKIIERDAVEALFDMDQFAQIFDDEEGLSELQTKSVDDKYEHWVATGYKQSGAPIEAYFFERDIRKNKPSRYEEEDAEAVHCINLVSPDGKKAIDIEVWEDGETDVMLTIYRPLSDIKDMYPKGKNT
jgi:hypothetical protein